LGNRYKWPVLERNNVKYIHENGKRDNAEHLETRKAQKKSASLLKNITRR